MKPLKRLLIGVLILSLLFIGITQGLIYSAHTIDQSDQPVDYIVILGARLVGDQPMLSLQYRLEKGLDYLEHHPDSRVICSGGRGNDELISEAAAMSNWLQARGIHPDRIIIEDQSHNTFENFLYSAKIIREQSDTSKVAIVTSGYHLFRARMLATRQGLEPILIAARTPKVVLIQQYLRESLALVKSYFLDR